MNTASADKVFAGSIPETYDRYLVPLIFEAYAEDAAQRLASHPPANLLEIAAGTGAVTRRLAASFPESTTIIATDLNPPMIEQARKAGTPRAVEWRQADAAQLPFPDGAFDVVVCQFGVMFFPDKARAFSEARRVLKPGGRFLFSVWDGIEVNEFADVATEALAALFPADPPRFMARTPHGYHDQAAIARELRAGGFTEMPRFTTVAQRSIAPSAEFAAIAYCQGTPLRNEIESRKGASVVEATAATSKAIAQRFGSGKIDGKIQATIIEVTA